MNSLARLDGAGTPFDVPEAIGYGRQPFVSLLSGPWMCVAGPAGVAAGAFCWVDPRSGQASNINIVLDSNGNPVLDNEGHQIRSGFGVLGFVLPQANSYNLWERAFINVGWPFAQQITRPGVACVVAVAGVFSPKFPLGGQVGTQVFADPATGLPYSGNVSGAYAATPYTLLQSGGPNCRLRMSSFVQPFPT